MGFIKIQYSKDVSVADYRDIDTSKMPGSARVTKTTVKPLIINLFTREMIEKIFDVDKG